MNEELFKIDPKRMKEGQRYVKIAVFIVYFLGALFATLIFSNHISTNFPDGVLKIVAYAGSWANFFSILVMLIAKDYWVSGTLMKTASWVFWVMEVAVLIMNVLASYGNDMFRWWAALAPAAPVLVVVIWGVMWYLSPDHKQREGATNFIADAAEAFIGMMGKARTSEEVTEYMRMAALIQTSDFVEQSMGIDKERVFAALEKKKTEQNSLPAPQTQSLPALSPNGHKEEMISFNSDTTTPGNPT